MAITLETVQQLCMEGESNHLDYKRDQYPFVGVSDPEKAELLKDILAMANAFRQQTAYILIGVEQQPDSSGKIIGISPNDFIDDAALQQFINGKTNKIVTLLSYPVQIDANRIIQVIEIPLQDDRPYYSKRRVGEVKENDVFFRVGSSTKIANPDDIAKMGAEQLSSPSIDISVLIPSNIIGNINSVTGIDIGIEQEPLIDETCNFNWMRNPFDYVPGTKDKVRWLQKGFKVIRIDIGLENISKTCVKSISVDTLLSQCSNNCVTEVDKFPIKNQFDTLAMVRGVHSVFENMLRPGEYKSAYESLYFEVNSQGSFSIEITVFGENIPVPIKKSFSFNVMLKSKTLDFDMVENLYDGIKDEDDFFDFRQQIATAK